MEGFGVLLFIVAIIASLFDQSRKKQAPPPPPRQQPLPRPSQRRPPRVQGRPPSPLPPAPAEGSASDMLSDDFWAELTGRSRGQPREGAASRQRETPPGEDLPSWDEEAVARVEEQSREVTNLPEARSLEDYRRPEVVREQRPVVSLERPVLPPERRHAEYHRKQESPAMSTPAIVARDAENPLRLRLRSQGALREGIIMQEIFGTPKGLE